MKICLILEGSYPYVRGGVSTWVDSMIRSLPQHEFVLWTINDVEEKKGKFEYEIPTNVSKIHEHFLSSSFDIRIKRNPKLKFSPEERNAFIELLTRGNPKWEVLLNIFSKHPNRPVEFFLSEDFLKMLEELINEEFQYAGFKDLFWTIRSIFLPLLYLMGRDFPEADIYHSPSTGYAGVLASLASIKYNKPFILTEHGIYTREREEELLRSDWIIPVFKDLWISTFAMYSKFAYDQAYSVTSLYENASLIQQELGCPPEKCTVIANGLDYHKLDLVPPKPNNGWIDIAAIVRFAHIKDNKTMIYTFHRLKQEIPNVRLHILGGIDDEDYYQECMQLIDYLKIKDIIIPGQVDIVPYLRNIDLTLLTSLSEGQPYAILESFAARRPVVSTDVGACRELIEGKENDELGMAGICVPPMHQTALLQALRDLCLNPEQREEMGEAGNRRVKISYDRDAMIQDYTQIYEEAIEKWQE